MSDVDRAVAAMDEACEAVRSSEDPFGSASDEELRPLAQILDEVTDPRGFKLPESLKATMAAAALVLSFAGCSGCYWPGSSNDEIHTQIVNLGPTSPTLGSQPLGQGSPVTDLRVCATRDDQSSFRLDWSTGTAPYSLSCSSGTSVHTQTLSGPCQERIDPPQGAGDWVCSVNGGTVAQPIRTDT